MRAKSIMQDERVCYVTGRTDCLDLHHIYGGPLRKASDREGFTVYLTHSVHMALHDHRAPFTGLKMQLRRECQAKYEETHSRDDFMRIIGRNYLD